MERTTLKQDNKYVDFIKNYDGSQYDMLPKFIKRRSDALTKLQLEHIQIQYQYNKRLQELEMEFDKLYQPLYEKRAKIISGEYEPTDEDCKLPENIHGDEPDGDQENSDADQTGQAFSEAEEKEMQASIKGLPGFWLACLSSTYNFSDSIEDYDRSVLIHLKDIKLSYDQKDDNLIYKLDFLFEENEYFTNDVLSKSYYLKVAPEDNNPLGYDGFEVYKSEGCTINWKPGKDVTKTTKTVNQKNKANGKTREKTKEVERDSFFYFFQPPKMPEGGEAEIDDEMGAIMAVDFELGELIRQSIIPKAPLYFMGHMMDEDDDDDDDDDEEDSEDYDSDSDEGSHESDSLKKHK